MKSSTSITVKGIYSFIASMLLSFCTITSGASAENLYVKATSPAPQDGSVARPYASIQQGVDAAAENATICVAAGEYVEQVNITSKSVTLRGGWNDDFTIHDSSSFTTTIKGRKTQCLVITGMRSGEISDFVFTGGIGDKGGAISIAGSNPTISNCIFIDNSATSGGGIYNYKSNTVITACTFSGNDARNGAGVYNEASSPVIRNCIFAGNYALDSGAGMFNLSSSLSIENCTFALNRSKFTGSAICNSASSSEVSNCILWQNASKALAPILNTDGSSPVFSYCCISGSGGSESWDASFGVDGGGNIDVPPDFADPGSWDDNGTPDTYSDDIWTIGDYHLRSIEGRWDPTADNGAGDWVVDNTTSPCIDAGDPSSEYQTEPGQNGGRVNMGAFGNTGEASVSPNQYLFTVNSKGVTAVEMQGTFAFTTNHSITVRERTEITVIAPILAHDEEFIRWANDKGELLSENPSYFFTITQDTTIVAEYRSQHNLYVNDETPENGIAAGNDENTGLSPEAPMRSIQALLDRYPNLGTGHTIRVSAGTYQENITIASNYSGLTIAGVDQETTIIDGSQSGSCISLNMVSDFTLTGITLTNGKAERGGGMYNYRSNLTIRDCTFESNSAESDTTSPVGGGIFNFAQSSIAIENCTFSDNTATHGAAIYSYYCSDVTVSDSTFVRNKALTDGGGIYGADNSRISVTNSSFTENRSMHGGCIFTDSQSEFIARNTVFSENAVDDWSGIKYWGYDANFSGSAIYSRESIIQIESCSFLRNRESSFLMSGSGVVYVDTCTVSIANSSFTDNNSSGENSFYLRNSDTTITNSIFDGNLSGYEFMYVSDGSLTISNSSITANRASRHLLYGDSTESITILNSIIWGNDGYWSPSVRGTISYSNIEGCGGSNDWDRDCGVDGGGNIDCDPLFVDPGFRENYSSPFQSGDYHLKSTVGRWDAAANGGNGGWIADEVSSPCIDTGGPSSDFSNEPGPSGCRVNMGAYGNTPQASLSEAPFSVHVDSQGASGVEISGSAAFITPHTCKTAATSSFVLIAPRRVGEAYFLRWKNTNDDTISYNTTCDLSIQGDYNIVAEYQHVTRFYINDAIAEQNIAAGNNNFPGTSPDAPMAGIQALLDCYPDVGAGQTIYVSAGTYAEKINLTAANSGLVLQGTGPGKTILNSNQVDSCINMESAADITIKSLSFTDCTATRGSGICSTYCSNITVENCTFEANTAETFGGGICGFDSDMLITDCTFNNNKSQDGAATYGSFSTVRVTNSSFISNYAESNGAAIGLDQANATVDNCVFSQNSTINGAGIWATGSEGTVNNCRFSANQVSTHGAGFYGMLSDFVLTNNIFVANNATSGGGDAIYARQSNPSVINCTLVANSPETGVALLLEVSNAVIANCILRNNAPGTQAYCNYGSQETTFTACNIENMIENGAWGRRLAKNGGGNFDTTPCFAAPGHWDDNNTPNDSEDDVWIEGDYHLKSSAGRWDPTANYGSGGWVRDDVTSCCIDAGSAEYAYNQEPAPNGERINSGAYGNTAEASKSSGFCTLTIASEGAVNAQMTQPIFQPTNVDLQVPVGARLTVRIAGSCDGAAFTRWKTSDGELIAYTRTAELSVPSDTTIIAEYEPITDFYVNDEIAEEGFAAGNDLNPGTSPDLPMATIGALLDRYSGIGNATLHVSAGNYEENISLDQSHSGLTLQGAGKDVTIINAKEGGLCLAASNAKGCQISGFTFTSGGDYLTGLNLEQSEISISSCSITGNSDGISADHSRLSLDDCSFSVNGTAVRTSSNLSLRITGCQFSSTTEVVRDDSESSIISDCAFSGRISFSGGDLLVENSTFTHPAWSNYAPIVSARGTSAHFDGCVFSDIGDSAIALYAQSGSIVDCTFDSIRLYAISSSANIVVKDSTFTDMKRGIYHWSNDIEVHNCSFTENQQQGIYLRESAASITGCTFTSTDDWGIYTQDNTSTLVEENDFYDNYGSLYANAGSLTVSGCTYSESGERRAIYSSAENLVVEDSKFAANPAGGIASFHDTTIKGCTFTANQTANYGGALSCGNGTLFIGNCIFEANTASKGGAIHCSDEVIPEIENCTFFGNEADYGAVVFLGNKNIQIKNSIFWGSKNPRIYSESNSKATFAYCIVKLSGGSDNWNESIGIDGGGNIELNPVFASVGMRDYLGPDSSKWIPGDYHLKSAFGRWDPAANGGNGAWVQDSISSSGIDAGDPDSAFSNEPLSNGGRINMGAYGNTAEASFSGNRLLGDTNFDCKVNIVDLIFIRNRLNKDVTTGDNTQADVNGDGKINVVDLIYVRNRLNSSCK